MAEPRLLRPFVEVLYNAVLLTNHLRSARERVIKRDLLTQAKVEGDAVSYTHLTLPTKRIV